MLNTQKEKMRDVGQCRIALSLPCLILSVRATFDQFAYEDAMEDERSDVGDNSDKFI